MGFAGTGWLICGWLVVSLLASSFSWAQPSGRYTSKRLELPRGTLNQPLEDHIFLGLFGQVGGGFEFQNGKLGYGGKILFRPGSAAHFLRALHDWNASLYIQADYQKVSNENRIFSGDVVIRPYWDDMRDPGSKVSPFFGVGIGASEVELPPGSTDRFQKSWSWLVEIGQEWTHQGKYMIEVKAQYRRYKKGEFDFSTWSVQAGAGVPWPW